MGPSSQPVGDSGSATTLIEPIKDIEEDAKDSGHLQNKISEQDGKKNIDEKPPVLTQQGYCYYPTAYPDRGNKNNPEWGNKNNNYQM